MRPVLVAVVLLSFAGFAVPAEPVKVAPEDLVVPGAPLRKAKEKYEGKDVEVTGTFKEGLPQRNSIKLRYRFVAVAQAGKRKVKVSWDVIFTDEPAILRDKGAKGKTFTVVGKCKLVNLESLAILDAKLVK